MISPKKSISFSVFSGKESFKKYKEVAELHKKMITTGFLSSFSSFILGQLYLSIAKSRYSALLVASDTDENILGFMGISYSTSSFYKNFLFGKGLLLSPLLLKRILSVTFLKKLTETLMYPFKKEKSSSESKKIDSEILNFCVDSKSQRMGIGKGIFEMAEIEFKKNNVSLIQIVTGSEQKSAHIFYENLGAELISTVEIHKNSQSFIYNYLI